MVGLESMLSIEAEEDPAKYSWDFVHALGGASNGEIVGAGGLKLMVEC